MNCKSCNDTRLVPFIKDDRLIPNAWVDCPDCEPEREYYREVRPEDFDFPMSHSFYRSLCKQHGWPDPGSEYAPEPPHETIRPVEVIYQRIAYIKPKRVSNKYNRYVL